MKVINILWIILSLNNKINADPARRRETKDRCSEAFSAALLTTLAFLRAFIADVDQLLQR
jgi:hypothetical protein